MTSNDKVFAGSIPELYDRLLVPLIFESYARDLASRVAAIKPDNLLETAAGTGVVTRALAATLPSTTTMTVTDLNQPMLQQAASKQTPGRTIKWQQADALALPFKDEEFDAVICQFGAMFFPDKIKGYSEARRVLKKNGRFFFSVWDRISENEFAEVITEALARLFPDDPPRFLARTPHGYFDIEQIKRELVAAGFTRVTADVLTARSRAASPRDPAIAYCHGTPLRSEIEARDPAGLERATNVASDAIAARFGNGAVDGRIGALIITATK